MVLTMHMTVANIVISGRSLVCLGVSGDWNLVMLDDGRIDLIRLGLDILRWLHPAVVFQLSAWYDLLHSNIWR